MKRRLSFLSLVTIILLMLIPLTLSTKAEEEVTKNDNPTDVVSNEILDDVPSDSTNDAVNDGSVPTIGDDSATETIETDNTSVTTEEQTIDAAQDGGTDSSPATVNNTEIEAKDETISASKTSTVMDNNGDDIDTSENTTATDVVPNVDNTDSTNTATEEDSAEGDTITDEAYLVENQISDEYQKEDGSLELDYSDAKNQSWFDVYLDTTLLGGLLEANPDQVLQINKGDVSVTLPLAILPTDQNFSFGLFRDPKTEGYLSPLYDFYIIQDDELLISEFESPVTLKFVIDPSLVKDWKNLRVVFIDDEGTNKEFITPIKYDKTTGEVWANVNHFSPYAVVEASSSNNSSIDSGSSDNGSSNNGSTNNSTINTGTINTGSNVTGTGTTNTSTATATTAIATKTSSTSASKNSTTSSIELPNTATNSFNILLAGLALIAIGGTVMFIKRRRVVK